MSDIGGYKSIFGSDITANDATPSEVVGEFRVGADGTLYRYIQAKEPISPSQALLAFNDGTVTIVETKLVPSPTSDSGGYYTGAPIVAFGLPAALAGQSAGTDYISDEYYGWVVWCGQVTGVYASGAIAVGSNLAPVIGESGKEGYVRAVVQGRYALTRAVTAANDGDTLTVGIR